MNDTDIQRSAAMFKNASTKDDSPLDAAIGKGTSYIQRSILDAGNCDQSMALKTVALTLSKLSQQMDTLIKLLESR